MGRLVKLWKSKESAESVAYRYGEDQERSGLLVIDKSTGAVSGPEPVPGMSAQDSWFLYGMLASQPFSSVPVRRPSAAGSHR